MPMISEKDAKLIREHLKKNLKDPVAIDHFTQGESPGGLPIQECQYLPRDRRAAPRGGRPLRPDHAAHPRPGDRRGQGEGDGDHPHPVVRPLGEGSGAGALLGIPSGYEFSSLIEDLVDVARGETDLAPKAVAELAGLKNRVHIQVFGTPT